MPAVPRARVKPYADAPRFPDAPSVDPRTLFDPSRPLEIEIGPGRGGFIFERLAADPQIAMIGFEIRRKWAAIVDGKLRTQGLSPRARVFAEDARFALPRVAAASVARLFIHFPDPWWKKRHEKRLVVTDRLLPQIVRVLSPGGELFVQTDVEERALAYETALSEATGLVPVGAGRLAENPFGARSPREHRALADGLPIHRLLYRRA